MPGSGALLDQLADEGMNLVITPVILHEFVHIVTDRKRFDPPVSMADALAVARVYLDHTNVECLSLDGQAIAGAFVLMEKHQLGRKRIADTLSRRMPSRSRSPRADHVQP